MEFLKNEPYLSMLNGIKESRKIIYLTYGGSLAYGTNTETSDIDLRGVALKNRGELIGSKRFEQFVNTETDTTIYAVDKFISLALGCNPNIIELLGTKKEHRFLVEPEMALILDNKYSFLSKKAIHLKNTLDNMKNHLQKHYTSYNDSNFNIYVDKTDREGFDTEMFVDIDMKHYPLRDFNCIQSEMNSAIKSYDKLNNRNKKKSEVKLDKHVMHLIRLHLMLIDILEKGEINTNREKEHDMLMDIRNGKWAENNYERLYVELDELEKRTEYAVRNTNLPDEPDYKLVEEILMEVNSKSL